MSPLDVVSITALAALLLSRIWRHIKPKHSPTAAKLTATLTLEKKS